MLLESVRKRVTIVRRWPKKYLAAAGLAIILLIWLLVPKSSGAGQKPQYVQVKKQDIKSTVTASGLLAGEHTASLKFKSPGKLAYVNVAANDSVEAGTVVAGLDTGDLAIRLQQARNNLRDKEASLEKVINDIKLFQFGNGGTSGETETQKQLRTQAEAAKDSAFDAVKEANRAFSDAVLVSPISGIVTQRNFLPGQNVSVADIVVQVVDNSQVFFDAEVDESDISQVSVGQRADVTLNSYPDKVFTGTIQEISPQTKTTSSGATVVVARINMGNPAIRFIANSNGQASIIKEQKLGVLSVPLEAVKDDNTIYVKTPQGPKALPIERGLSSDTDIEIIKGLSENQEVVTNPQVIKENKKRFFFF